MLLLRLPKADARSRLDTKTRGYFATYDAKWHKQEVFFEDASAAWSKKAAGDLVLLQRGRYQA